MRAHTYQDTTEKIIKKAIIIAVMNAIFKLLKSNCVQKPEKVRTSTGFEPVTSRYQCDALTN